MASIMSRRSRAFSCSTRAAADDMTVSCADRPAHSRPPLTRHRSGTHHSRQPHPSHPSCLWRDRDRKSPATWFRDCPSPHKTRGLPETPDCASNTGRDPLDRRQKTAGRCQDRISRFRAGGRADRSSCADRPPRNPGHVDWKTMREQAGDVWCSCRQLKTARGKMGRKSDPNVLAVTSLQIVELAERPILSRRGIQYACRY